MITILSPAKTINMDKVQITGKYSKPEFLDNAALLIDELKKFAPPEMESLMKINSELAELNFKRHIVWTRDHSYDRSKQALLSYSGMVYNGLNAASLKEEQLQFAQEHIRILSGLYGVLKPLDLIMPYRLEMGTKLENIRGKDLYIFWKKLITEFFIEELSRQDTNVLINLASNEYSAAIDMKKLNSKIITPIFKDYSKGSYKVITIYAKKARGLMARFIAENGIDSPEELKEFEEEGYRFDAYRSTDTQWVFLRNNLNSDFL
jgi:cytoplasmic iron level regulating protein YaaA (DUF328/UPF0246 family)